jgi:hypothetical protein
MILEEMLWILELIKDFIIKKLKIKIFEGQNENNL